MTNDYIQTPLLITFMLVGPALRTMAASGGKIVRSARWPGPKNVVCDTCCWKVCVWCGWKAKLWWSLKFWPWTDCAWSAKTPKWEKSAGTARLLCPKWVGVNCCWACCGCWGGCQSVIERACIRGREYERKSYYLRVSEWVRQARCVLLNERQSEGYLI